MNNIFFSNIDECKDIFFQRVLQLITQNDTDESKSFLREFYEESPDYMENEDFMRMFETLNWLSYPNNYKKKLLDSELDNYFS